MAPFGQHPAFVVLLSVRVTVAPAVHDKLGPLLLPLELLPVPLVADADVVVVALGSVAQKPHFVFAPVSS